MDQEQISWLDGQFARRELDAIVHTNLTRKDNDWVYVPVYVPMRDAYDKATLLQEIEDEWEQKWPDVHLLLTPAAK